MKRVFSLFLVLVLLVGMLPVPAQATQPDAEMTNDDVTIEGTNGFGTLLSQEINEEQLSTENYEGGYALTDLQIVGNLAVVSYSAISEATLVVSVYTEDGLTLLNSAHTIVSPDFEEATVNFEGEMPEYFQASAFLLNVNDLTPLCDSYDTPMYTREMQDLQNSTVDDYDPELVLNLDDSKETNFAVYQEDTIQIEAEQGVNTVASVDNENAVYVIENADESITSLREGDIFAYPYTGNDILIVKVASITVDGTTATIYGADMEMEEVFSYVKIETAGDTSDVEVDESTGNDGITYTGMTPKQATYAQRGRAWEGEGDTGFTLNFDLYKRKYESDSKDSEYEVNGTLTLELKVDFSYYIAFKSQFFTFGLDNTVTLHGGISGKHTGTLAKFPSFGISPIPGVYIGFEPKLVLEFEGEFTLGLVYNAGINFNFESGKGVKRYSEKPVVDFELEVEGTIFFGIDMCPHVKVVGGAVAEFELSALGGFELNAKLTGKLHLAGEEERGEKIHTCNACLSVDVTAKVEFELKIKFLKLKCLTFNFKLAVLKYDIGVFYISFDNMEFGWGSCPYIEYQVILIAKTQKGKVVPGTEIYNSAGEILGTTDANGQLIIYLREGVYHFGAIIDGDEISKRAKVDDPCRVILRADSDSAYSAVFGTLDAESITNYGAVVAGGDCNDTVTWTLYENDTLVIDGEGAMSVPEENWAEYKSDITAVVVRDGITGIPSSAFSGYENLTTVVIADSVTSWGHSCFTNCTSLKYVSVPVDYYIANDYQAFYGYSTFYGCNQVEYIRYTPGTTGKMQDRDYYQNGGTHAGEQSYKYMLEYSAKDTLTSVEFAEGVTHIGVYAFYSCSVLETAALPSTLESIGSYAFYGNGSLRTVDLPYGLTSLGGYAFSGCSSLNDITIPSTLTEIPGYAFNGCTSIQEIEVPDSVTTIGDSAFAGCTGLSSVVVADSVTSWGDLCFGNCTGLKYVSVPVDYAVVNTTTPFKGCDQVEYIRYTPGTTGKMQDRDYYYGGGSIYDGHYRNEYTMEYASRATLKEVEFTEGVTHIGARAFYGCSTLTTVQISSTLESIGGSAFSGVTADMYYPAEAESWNADLMQNYGGTLTWIPVNAEGEVVMTQEAVQDVLEIPEETLPEETVPEETVPEETVPKETEPQETEPEESEPTETEPVETEPSVTEPVETEPAETEPPVTEPEETEPEETEAPETEPVETEPAETQAETEPAAATLMAPMAGPSFLTASPVTLSVSLLSLLVPDAPEETIPAETEPEETRIVETAQTVSSPAVNTIYGGDYSVEELETYTLTTASFSGLVPGEEYLLLAVWDLEAEDILDFSNLIHIDQAPAGDDGTLRFEYVEREAAEKSYVMAIGASNMDLKDAVITFPEMNADGQLHVVDPTVAYDGKTLIEGTDYTILGTGSYTAAGEYTCYIQGIHNYTGLIKCTYTVSNRKGDVNVDGEVNDADAVYLFWHTLFPELYPLDESAADFDGDGAVTEADAVVLLWHTLFPELYPL